MLGDQRRLVRRLDEAGKRDDPTTKGTLLDRLGADISSAEQRIERRRAAITEITYPPELPVTQQKDKIADAIRDHQVAVIAGETGSGKTTQIPKICLELGRGIQGLIGHTQPRRLAARTVADRIAAELKVPLGEAVGYAVRFTDKAGPDTLVKLMTDGILLAEIQRDRLLSQYDTLIIDEAHERSLNVDFLLGYLKQLLPRRPDLKLIITSATIDPQRFSDHFGTAPIIEVSGRAYPVELRYRPIIDPENPSTFDRDQTQAILDAIRELTAEPPGDVLVFLSGEREIRDTAESLRQLELPQTEIVPLYARLSASEQNRVFQPHRGRRVILATNVAETSLTVPGIKYVVDPGTARISRYSHRTKVQHLPIEPVSQASANQRKGRCGRTSAGICIRLYAEDDFDSRPEFTEPEILRTNLASVILHMTALDLGDISAFPFIDEPDKRSVSDGVQLLHELGAIIGAPSGPRHRLTPVGRKLAQLPLDPRLARMIIEGDRNGCVREIMIITAGLSIQDPRERPAEHEQAAQQMHARFRDPSSDFLGYLNLWGYVREQQKELSSNQFRRLCRSDFLNYLRIREWQDIYAQLRQVAASLNIKLNTTPADPQRVHLSLLAGLLSQIGMKDAAKQRDYLGARNARFALFPGSALFKTPPRWVMAAELVDTSRLWARDVAKIEPEWAEGLAQHLVKRSFSEPHWERKRGGVVALEKVTLYGLPIVIGRKVNYGKIDAVVARDLFIRHALVEGDWDTQHRFFQENRTLVEEVEELEQRSRRRDLLVDDETLFDFYDERLGAEVVSGQHFDSWWKIARRAEPDLLDFERSLLLRDGADGVSEQDFPNAWQQGQFVFPLSYTFGSGARPGADGVTVDIPLMLLSQVKPIGFEWLIPGRREELVTALIKSLPKPIRRNIVPAPDYARALLPALRGVGAEEPLLETLERELRTLRGILIERDNWDWERVPDHLRMTFRIVDDQNQKVAEGKDLTALQDELRPKARIAIARGAQEIERDGLTSWTFDSVPKLFEQKRSGLLVPGYPALVDAGSSVSIRVLESKIAQHQAMAGGIRRLLMLTIPPMTSQVQRRLSSHSKMMLSQSPHGDFADLLSDCVSCAVDQLMTEQGGLVWTRDEFERLRDALHPALSGAVFGILGQVETILDLARTITLRLSAATSPSMRPALADIRDQLAGLVYRGFVTEAGKGRLADVARYLRGLAIRLEKLPSSIERDLQWTQVVGALTDEYHRVVAAIPSSQPLPEPLVEVRWMLEELRISYFAQTLGTRYPVSDKRVIKVLDSI
jgi:ATP-dependent helicase HrpA